MEDLCKGFSDAYRVYLKNRNVTEQKTQNMGDNDLQRQLNLIRLTFEMMNQKNRKNCYFKDRKAAESRSKEVLDSAIKRLVNAISTEAVVEKGDIGWMTLCQEGNQYWRLEPAGFDFYNGISGIAVFFALIKKAGFLTNVTVYELALQRLFRYTDGNNIASNIENGLFTGPTSIAFAYLLLYRITNETLFLNLFIYAASEVMDY